MGAQPPPGEPAPRDGALPESALTGLGTRPFGVYVHIPFCAHRCGYCDFNTYADLSGLQASYADAAVAELELAARVLGTPPVVETVFFGGGTPTLLPALDLARILHRIEDLFGLAPGAEVTTEANPETVDPGYLEALRAVGFTRLSLGMQSAQPHVLAVLERRHTAGRPEQCVGWAHAAGFEQVNLDLIHGTPGESLADWRASLLAAIACGPDHISAYSLIVEPGTRLAAQVDRGELTSPDEELQADGYELADALLTRAGFAAYEISNWAKPGAQCRHNLGYWRGDDWWGIGPGGHSHVGGVRWWNVRHPRDYAAALTRGDSPGEAREVLDEEARRVERVLLGVRLAEGHPVADLRPAGREAAARHAAGALLEPAALAAGRLVLTRRGRLLADLVIRDLVD